MSTPAIIVIGPNSPLTSSGFGRIRNEDTNAPTINGGTVHRSSLNGTSPRRSQPVAPLLIPTAWVTNASFNALTGSTR